MTGQTALAVAHPGHELWLTEWIAQARPQVFILTAGSRNGASCSRVQASRRLAGTLGAQPGAVFGRHLDREVYGWIMDGDARPFLSLADELASAFAAAGVRRVVTDSWQLYNVVHDLWRLTVAAAAAIASERVGAEVECLDYPVVPAAMGARALGPERLRLQLSPEAVARKLALARAFPEIAQDLGEVLERGGEALLATETLHAARPLDELLPAPGEAPLYEQYGEARVAAGLYSSVLRWRHVAPIAQRLGAALKVPAAAP